MPIHAPSDGGRYDGGVSRLVHKSHNVSILLYHLVCASKYRRRVVGPEVDQALRMVCLEIADRYEIEFLEIGTDRDHVHFLIQSVPSLSPTRLATIIKSVTGREMFRRCPAVKESLWGASFWSSGYFISSVGRYGCESAIRRYVRDQGLEVDYSPLHRDYGQLSLDPLVLFDAPEV